MSTKNKPSENDCYEKAMDDEPMFTLLARDPVAPILISMWIKMRLLLNNIDESQHLEALTIINDMTEWRKSRW